MRGIFFKFSALSRKLLILFALCLTLSLGLFFFVFPSNKSLKAEGRLRTGTYCVTPLMPGVISNICVKEGDYVKEGELLLRLDQSSIENQIKKAEAQCEKARAQFSISKGFADEVMSEYIKVRKQIERGAASEDELNFSIKSLHEAEAGKNLAKAELSIVEADLARAAAEKQWMDVRSSINGLVASVKKKSGEHVANETVLEIINLKDAWIETYVKEKDLKTIHLQMPVQVSLPDFNTVIATRVQSISPASNGKYLVRIQLPLEGLKDSFYIRPNMAAEIFFDPHLK